jgi:hypothetical protein
MKWNAPFVNAYLVWRHGRSSGSECSYRFCKSRMLLANKGIQKSQPFFAPLSLVYSCHPTVHIRADFTYSFIMYNYLHCCRFFITLHSAYTCMAMGAYRTFWKGRGVHTVFQQEDANTSAYNDRCGPVIPPGTGFPFRRLLRLAGLQWGYSNLPPHGRKQKLNHRKF